MNTTESEQRSATTALANDSGGGRTLRVLELFAGIGGLHWALKVASIPCKVVAAMEINPTVMEIYSHNFKDANLISKNLQGITAKEINELQIDAIVMSPPCQPFCRTGNRLDVDDNRTGPLTQITEVLGNVKFEYIFVENVQGFETSVARENLLQVLTGLSFKWQEFMLTPKTVGVPNSRLRYYLIGKHSKKPWAFSLQQGTLLSEIPEWDAPEIMPFGRLRRQYELIRNTGRTSWMQRNLDIEKTADDSFCVGDVIEWHLSDQLVAQLKVPDSVKKKYYQAMDIVTPLSANTCCFTKGYGNFVKGTGSILKINDCDNNEFSGQTDDDLLRLRYFSPREICRLMSYPEEFDFPKHLSLRQKYRSLGNSVNVYVVAILFSLLFTNSN